MNEDVKRALEPAREWRQKRKQALEEMCEEAKRKFRARLDGLVLESVQRALGLTVVCQLSTTEDYQSGYSIVRVHASAPSRYTPELTAAFEVRGEIFNLTLRSTGDWYLFSIGQHPSVVIESQDLQHYLLLLLADEISHDESDD